MLVVEDDEVDRMIVTRALRRLDADLIITEVTSAREALDMLRAQPFDCVLSDLHMPGDDGAWLLGSIRSLALDTPLVVLTGQGDERTAVELMKAGAADYVPKSTLTPERLAIVLNHAIRIHRAERETRRTQERLALALEATGLGTWDFDPRTGVVVRDARCRAILGLAEGDELDLDGHLDIVHPEDREAVRARIAASLATGSHGRFRSEHRVRSSGVVRWVRAEGRVYFATDGRPVRLIGTVQDITRQRAEEDSVQARLEFEQQLIGIVSHDLRNPISAMIVGARLLGHQVDASSSLADVAGRIESSGERAARLIRDLLDFTQVRTGNRIPITCEDADVHAVCRQVIDELALNHPNRRIEHLCEGDGTGWWDPDRVGQVVGNLLRNALSYSPKDTRVTVRSADATDHVEIHVHNVNAAGPIPDHVRASLFQPYRRGDHRPDSDRSIGLGLFIVSEIVSAHGGSVDLDSDAHGTTFRVCLPRIARG